MIRAKTDCRSDDSARWGAHAESGITVSRRWIMTWKCFWAGCREPVFRSDLWCVEHNPKQPYYTPEPAYAAPHPKPRRAVPPIDPERERLKAQYLAEMRGEG